MGLFKDAFGAMKGAKELGDYHGGMPSVKGSFQDIKALDRLAVDAQADCYGALNLFRTGGGHGA